MEKETFMQIIFISFFLLSFVFVLYGYKLRDQKRQNKKMLIQFIGSILTLFSRASGCEHKESRIFYIKIVTKHIRNHTEMELYMLMTRTNVPIKCDYPLVDSSNNNLVNEIFTLLVDLHSRYKKNLIDMDDLTDEFYQKLEGYILKLL